jgi:sugar phosphate isomerase/epimerase
MTQVAVTLSVFGRLDAADLHGVLHAVQAAGYDGVELPAPVPASTAPAAEVRGLLEDHGLSAATVSAGFAEVADAARRSEIAAFARVVGAPAVVVAGTAGREPPDLDRTADALNDAGRALRDAGVGLAWRHQGWEAAAGGGRGLDRIVGRFDPALVRVAPDVYWLHFCGLEPAGRLRAWADRIAAVYVRDGVSGGFAELGRGVVPLRAALAAAVELGVDRLIAAQDAARRPPAEVIRDNREFLRRLGFL